MNCPKCGGDEVESLCLTVNPPIHVNKCLSRGCGWTWQKGGPGRIDCCVCGNTYIKRSGGDLCPACKSSNRGVKPKEDPMPKTYEQRLEELEAQIAALKLEVAELRGFNHGLQANRFPEPAVWSPPITGTGSPYIKDFQIYYDGAAPPQNGWSQIDTQAFEDKHAIIPTTDHDESPDAQTAIQQAQHADDYLQANVQ